MVNNDSKYSTTIDYIILSFWSAQTLAMSLISRNVAGQTKKTTVVAANFIGWAVGNSIGEL